jgi:predicted methyltransferase/GH35 family endo-1,4-beta-xylanase
LIPEEVIPGSIAERYQKLVLARFNTIVLSNAGKWAYQEERRDRETLEHVDRFFAFAEKHGLRARMHTMLWDTTQQPEWVGSLDPQRPGLMTRAKNGDARAKADLDRQIEERIGYYVRDRAKRYLELDVINESVHKPRYLQIYGAAGLAEIFEKTASAAKQAGARTRLFLNEYNVLQWSEDPRSGAPDPYANWYRRHADSLIAAGGQVDGLGVQYYPDGRSARQIGSNAHSPARAFAALQNLATTGRRLSLTELTVNAPNATPARAATIVEDTARLVFGTPEADTFMLWAMWAGAAGDPPFPASVLADLDFKPTVVGERFDALMKSWSTEIEVPVGPDGTVAFDGFFGDYLIAVGNRTERFSFTRDMARGTAGGAAGRAPKSAIGAAVLASDRSSDDRALDAGRKPKELLEFCGVAPGMRVAELGAGGGYTAELLSRVVGPSGKVYGQNSKFLLERFAEKPWSERLKKPVLSNVIRVDRDFDDPLPPDANNLDVVMLVLFYHDTVWQKVDRARMNRNVRAALKPGGTFCVVDHSARPGSGAAHTETLHRIEEAFVRNEIGQAGFKLAAEGSFLRNSADTRDWNASPRKAGERRGASDRFVLRFEKR